MKYFLSLVGVLVGIIGFVCSLILFVSHIMAGDFTGAMAWLFGIAINALSVIINISYIKEQL